MVFDDVALEDFGILDARAPGVVKAVGGVVSGTAAGNGRFKMRGLAVCVDGGAVVDVDLVVGAIEGVKGLQGILVVVGDPDVSLIAVAGADCSDLDWEVGGVGDDDVAVTIEDLDGAGAGVEDLAGDFDVAALN